MELLMSKVIPGSARAAVTAGLSAALALETLPTSAIAEAMTEPDASAAQEQVQTQQDAQVTEGEAEDEGASGTAEGADQASEDPDKVKSANAAEGADPEADAATGADASSAAIADAASEEAEATEASPAIAEQAPAADAPADVTPVADEAAMITRNGAETRYDSLTTAVANLQDDDTLTILKTVADNIEITTSRM